MAGIGRYSIAIHRLCFVMSGSGEEFCTPRVSRFSAIRYELQSSDSGCRFFFLAAREDGLHLYDGPITAD
jgi:hypothetical protein